METIYIICKGSKNAVPGNMVPKARDPIKRGKMGNQAKIKKRPSKSQCKNGNKQEGARSGPSTEKKQRPRSPQKNYNPIVQQI